MNTLVLWSESLWAFLCELLFKSSLLLILAIALDWALCLRRAPLQRSSMWNACLIGLLLLPLGVSFLPPIAIDVVPQGQPPFGPDSSFDLKTKSMRQTRYSEISAEPNTGLQTARREPAPLGSNALASQVRGIEPRQTESSTISWSLIGAIAFACGTAVAASRFASAIWGSRRLIRSAEAVSSRMWQRRHRQWCASLGLTRTVRLVKSSRISVPMVVGWLRCYLILPPPLEQETDRERADAILVHELAHVRRHDLFWQLLLRLLQVVYWFHPLVWCVERRIAETRERACDDFCICAVGRDNYSESLLALASQLVRTASVGVGLAVMRAPRIAVRLEAIRRSRGSRVCVASWSSRATWICSATIVTVLLGPVVQGSGIDGADQPPLPSGADIIEGFAAREAAVASLSANCEVEQTNHFRTPSGDPPPKGLIQDDAVLSISELTAQWKVESRGRGWLKSFGVHTSVDTDGEKVTRIFEYLSAFDGQQGKQLEIRVGDGDVSRQARISDGFMRNSESPLDITTRHLGTPLSRILSQRSATIVRTESWQERPVVVVETSPKTVRQDEFKTQFWVDCARNFLVVRRQILERHSGAKLPWRLHYSLDAYDHAEVSHGVWLPMRVEKKVLNVTRDAPPRIVSTTKMTISDWQLNPAIQDSQFQLEIPRGVETRVVVNPKRTDAGKLRSDPTYFAPVQLEVRSVIAPVHLKARRSDIPRDDDGASRQRQAVVSVRALAPLSRQSAEFRRAFNRTKGYIALRNTPKYLSFAVERAAVSDKDDGPLAWTPCGNMNSALAQAQRGPWDYVTQELTDVRFVDPHLTMATPHLVLEDLGPIALHSAVPRGKPSNQQPTVQAPDPAEVTQEAEFLLIRWFDFRVTPGKKYRYRIRVLLEDPNHPQDARFDPPPDSLDETVKARLNVVAEQEARLSGRIYYVYTDCSEPSEVVSVDASP